MFTTDVKVNDLMKQSDKMNRIRNKFGSV